MDTFLIYALFVGCLIILTFFRPSAGAVAVLLMFAFEQWAQAHNSYFMQHNWLTNYLFLGITLFGLIIKWIREGLATPVPDLSAATVIALYFYAALSASWSPAPEKAQEIWLFLSPFLILMIVVTPLLIKKAQDLGVLFFSYLMFAIPLALLLIFTVEWWERYLVIKGTKSPFDANPNAIGNVGIMMFMLCMVLDIKGTNTKTKLEMLWPIVKWPIMLLGVALAIKAQSRGQLFAAGLAILYAYWTKQEGKKPTLLLGLVLFTCVIGVAFNIIFDSIIEDTARWSTEKMTDDALLRLNASIKMLSLWSGDVSSILFGLGSAAAYAHVGLYPHVIPVEILTEQGLIGFCLFTMMLVLTFRNIKTFMQRCSDKRQRSYFICLAGYFLIELTLSLKQGSLPLSPSLFFTVVMIAHVTRYQKRLPIPISSLKRNIPALSQPKGSRFNLA